MFNLPEILTIVIGALLALVFIDGIRRAIRIKRSSLKVDLIDVEQYVSKDFEEEWMQSFSDEPSEQEFEDKKEEVPLDIKPSSSLLILHLDSQKKDQFSKHSINFILFGGDKERLLFCTYLLIISRLKSQSLFQQPSLFIESISCIDGVHPQKKLTVSLIAIR